jgi:hypothetical protein
MGGFVLTLLLALQDPKDDLRDAVVEANASKARGAIEKLLSQNTAHAVEVLLANLGAVKKEELEQKKKKSVEPENPATRILRRGRTEQDVKLEALAAIREAILAALSKFTSDDAVKALIDRFRNSPDWNVRAGVAAVLENIDRDDVLRALLEQLKKEKEPTVKVAIVEALSAKKGPEVEAAILDALKSDIWQIQIAALDAIEKQKLHSAVEAVIEAMGKAEGRMLYEFQATLMALTGVDKGIMPDAWKAWWEQNKEAVKGGTYAPRPEEKAGKGAGFTTFFGVPINSKRVVFVLDRSGSMAQPADFDIPIDTGEVKLPDDLKQPAGKRKIDVARWQLKKALFLLPDGVLFNLIFYNGAFEAYKDKLIKLDKKSREEAFAYIDRLEPQGGTNVFDSLEKALSFAMGDDGRLKKDGVDSIYLLSDGMPNQGKFTQGPDICREIKSINDRLKVAVHTILIDAGGSGGVVIRRVNGREVPPPQPQGPSEAEQLMKRLADENGGTFSAVRKKKTD